MPILEDRFFHCSSFSEYYFSPENLQADIFLRQQMTKDGYVPLVLIANFNRVQSLCPDIYLIADVRFETYIRSLIIVFYLGYSR